MPSKKKLKKRIARLTKLLVEVRELCLSADDHGIAVSEDIVLDAETFDAICAGINDEPYPVEESPTQLT
jgi:hypothetical protein